MSTPPGVHCTPCTEEATPPCQIEFLAYLLNTLLAIIARVHHADCHAHVVLVEKGRGSPCLQRCLDVRLPYTRAPVHRVDFACRPVCIFFSTWPKTKSASLYLAVCRCSMLHSCLVHSRGDFSKSTHMHDQKGARLSSHHTCVALHGFVSGWCFFCAQRS